ncbi:hypothetical protein [Streptomyces sp. NPDC057557]|uniref:hypothetical protein n=1 Tax=Streptomyces sp. NPDC057557 TaxID=3346167 RepID=UPI0036CFE9CA
MRARNSISALLTATSLLATVGAVAAPASASSRALGDTLKVGGLINLQNQLNGGSGGYLEIYTTSTAPGASYTVDTTPTDRGSNTATWRVVSASGRPQGSAVRSGDAIYLVNAYSTGNFYLDVNTYQDRPAAWWDVSVTTTKNRDGDSGKWRITAETSNPVDGVVRSGDKIHLESLYEGNGGFLDINGLGGPGYDVSTTTYWDRNGNGTATWKVLTK